MLKKVHIVKRRKGCSLGNGIHIERFTYALQQACNVWARVRITHTQTRESINLRERACTNHRAAFCNQGAQVRSIVHKFCISLIDDKQNILGKRARKCKNFFFGIRWSRGVIRRCNEHNACALIDCSAHGLQVIAEIGHRHFDWLCAHEQSYQLVYRKTVYAHHRFGSRAKERMGNQLKHLVRTIAKHQLVTANF